MNIHVDAHKFPVDGRQDYGRHVTKHVCWKPCVCFPNKAPSVVCFRFVTISIVVPMTLKFSIVCTLIFLTFSDNLENLMVCSVFFSVAYR